MVSVYSISIFLEDGKRDHQRMEFQLSSLVEGNQEESFFQSTLTKYMALKGWTQTIFFFHNQVTATITGLNLQDGRGFREREIKYIQMPPFGELLARSSTTSTSSTARKIYLRGRTCTSKCCTLIASKHRRQLVPLKDDGKFHLRIVPFLLLKKTVDLFLSMSWYPT